MPSLGVRSPCLVTMRCMHTRRKSGLNRILLMIRFSKFFQKWVRHFLIVNKSILIQCTIKYPFFGWEMAKRSVWVKKIMCLNAKFLSIYKVEMPNSCWTKFENSDHSACCRLCVAVNKIFFFSTIPVPVTKK